MQRNNGRNNKMQKGQRGVQRHASHK
jgi:hypothetical protein